MHNGENIVIVVKTSLAIVFITLADTKLKMEKELYSVVNNESELKFEVHLDGELAYLEYRFYKKDIALMHTVVPDSLGGKGIASALAHYALEWATKHEKPVMVYCPFVAGYLQKHPEYDGIIDKQHR